jgi:hypothetical protein
MKTLFILLSVLLVNQECTTEPNQEDLSVVYTANSRGSYFEVKINHDSVSINRQRGGAPIIKTYPETLRNKLFSELNKIDLKQLKTFEPPSENHHVDGALIASLYIIKNNKTYQSKSFDHNNPPKEIATIVKEILSIVENIE